MPVRSLPVLLCALLTQGCYPTFAEWPSVTPDEPQPDPEPQPQAQPQAVAPAPAPASPPVAEATAPTPPTPPVAEATTTPPPAAPTPTPPPAPREPVRPAKPATQRPGGPSVEAHSSRDGRGLSPPASIYLWFKVRAPAEQPASDLTLVVAVPPGTDYEWSKGPGAHHDAEGRTVTWRIGALEAADYVQVEVGVRVLDEAARLPAIRTAAVLRRKGSVVATSAEVVIPIETD